VLQSKILIEIDLCEFETRTSNHYTTFNSLYLSKESIVIIS